MEEEKGLDASTPDRDASADAGRVVDSGDASFVGERVAGKEFDVGST